MTFLFEDLNLLELVALTPFELGVGGADFTSFMIFFVYNMTLRD